MKIKTEQLYNSDNLFVTIKYGMIRIIQNEKNLLINLSGVEVINFSLKYVIIDS